MIKKAVSSFLARCDALVAKVPSLVRTIVGPVVAPVFALGRTVLLTVTGNVQAILDEPLVVGNAVAQVFLELEGASIRDRLIAAATVLLRAVVHTGVGPNAAEASVSRVSPSTPVSPMP